MNETLERASSDVFLFKEDGEALTVKASTRASSLTRSFSGIYLLITFLQG